MNGYTCFRKLFYQIFRIGKVLGYYHKYFVDPFLAHIHGCAAFCGYHRNTADFLTGAVLINHNYACKRISGIVVFLHIDYHLLCLSFGCDDQKLLVATVFHFSM